MARRRQRKLGRRRPSDWRHVERYPLGAIGAAEPAPAPVVLGVNWYSNFDDPVRDGSLYWIGRGSLGSVRGGHAICARPYHGDDLTSWWEFYDQGEEGACVGFAWSRCMSLLNRRRYAARWLYQQAQLGDEYADTPPEEGTSVRAGGNVLIGQGHERVYGSRTYAADPAQGIQRFRWATSWDEVRSALGLPGSYDGVTLLNSWGRYYPHLVRITDEAGERLLAEDGEAAVPTDR